eukprot:8275951-Pyramimonas_sp.AAC.1
MRAVHGAMRPGLLARQPPCARWHETAVGNDIWLAGSAASAAAVPSPHADSGDWMRGRSGSQKRWCGNDSGAP